MAILVSELLLRIGRVLGDEDSYTRWTKEELMSWINEAAVAVIHQRPNAHSTTSTLTLVAGTKQTLPSNSNMLLDVVRNLGDGSTPSRSVTRTTIGALNNSFPDWHSSTANAVTKNYAYNPQDDKMSFYVYPQAIAGKVLQVILSTFPAEVVASNDTLDMPYEYMDSIINYSLFRAFSKDSEYANGQMAAAHFSAFQASLGIYPQVVRGAT